MELYKKYRPDNFDKMIGNESILEVIDSKIKSKNLPHFILLSGPSGCGKTTIARIIKDKLDCHSQDFYEINCANNNGVELARDIEKKFRMKSIQGGVRIWLLDEAHKLTSACQESLLKPLEDTPEHVYFIFSTTNPSKILNTVKTRATEFKVTSLSSAQSEKLIKKVCKKEKIKIPKEVQNSIIESSQGSARLILVCLDKIKDLDEDKMLEASKEIIEQEAEAFAIYKALMWGKWPDCAKALKLNNSKPEDVRRFVLACASKLLLDSTKRKQHSRAFDILSSFENPLYDTLKPGLIMCCYDVFNG